MDPWIFKLTKTEGRKHPEDISGRERGCKLNFLSTSIYSLKEPLIFSYKPFCSASPHPDTFLFLGVDMMMRMYCLDLELLHQPIGSLRRASTSLSEAWGVLTAGKGLQTDSSSVCSIILDIFQNPLIPVGKDEMFSYPQFPSQNFNLTHIHWKPTLCQLMR